MDAISSISGLHPKIQFAHKLFQWIWQRNKNLVINKFSRIFFNLKICPKICILMAVFFLCSPDCPKQSRTLYPFYKFFYPTISGRISGGNILPEPVTQFLILCLFCDQNNEKEKWNWEFERLNKIEIVVSACRHEKQSTYIRKVSFLCLLQVWPYLDRGGGDPKKRSRSPLKPIYLSWLLIKVCA